MYSPQYLGPNEDFLEAQARVCTGPHQTRPLGKKESDGPHPDQIFEIILDSLNGKLDSKHAVSEAQMGAFFTAMTIRKYFPESTQWSTAEKDAFNKYYSILNTHLPKDIKFLIDPTLEYISQNPTEHIVVTALQKILQGQHLGYTETRQMCEAIMTNEVKPALKAGALIGQRMNRETYEEVRGYLDSYYAPKNVQPIDVDNLTHFGQPYDGATRYFRPTLFIAAVRAALGQPSILHSVDMMPPKNGITEEAILQSLGAKTDLTLEQVSKVITNENVGFGYVSQREYSPGAYNIRELRVHIKKRPPWAATEKALQFFTAQKNNYMVIGYYHIGYEKPLLQMALERGCQGAVAIKGEEGTSSYSLRLGKPSTPERMAVNYSQGFLCVNGKREEFSLDIDPKMYGFDYQINPRPDVISAEAYAEEGVAALSGKKGQIYDRIVLNTAIVDYLLGIYADPYVAIEQVREVIENGSALDHLKAYISVSNEI
ncbi:hypothetical protein JT359_13585 [Candidatus Poribacteria bacterium]|nr:hypothetical protein [Candidatus Poribacteria bacterium]